MIPSEDIELCLNPKAAAASKFYCGLSLRMQNLILWDAPFMERAKRLEVIIKKSQLSGMAYALGEPFALSWLEANAMAQTAFIHFLLRENTPLPMLCKAAHMFLEKAFQRYLMICAVTPASFFGAARFLEKLKFAKALTMPGLLFVNGKIKSGILWHREADNV